MRTSIFGTSIQNSSMLFFLVFLQKLLQKPRFSLHGSTTMPENTPLGVLLTVSPSIPSKVSAEDFRRIRSSDFF